MEKNKIKDKSNIEESKKRKSRFGVVLGLVVVSLGVSFSYLTLTQKDKYIVLDNSSKEVKSRVAKIKDLRTLKGYKVIEESGNNKLILLSAGLTYDPSGNIEVTDIVFNKNATKIVVKESIDKNPEKEKITYPYMIVKLNSEIDELIVVSESGEKYEEIFLNKHTNEEPNKSENKDLNEKIEVEKDKGSDSNTDEGKKDEDKKKGLKTLNCTYEGKADGTTIEVSVGAEYKTFDISDVVKSFDNMDIGKQITIEYIESEGNSKVVSVK